MLDDICYSEHGGSEDNSRFERGGRRLSKSALLMTAHLLLLVKAPSEGTLQFAVETTDLVF
jgi:hypothetical protein